MRTRNGKRTELWRKTALSAAGLFLAASLSVFLMSPVRAAEETDPDHFLDGLSESERTQFLDEVYSDMESDSVSTESTPFTQALEEELEQSGGSASEEEATERFLDSMPSDEELMDYAEGATQRVMSIASFRTGYDPDKQLFRYTLTEDTGRIGLSVPLGGWSDRAVALLPENGALITEIQRDGEDFAAEPGEDGAYFFRETGDYSFAVTGSEQSGAYIMGTFRIVSVQVPVSDSRIWSPEGYRLTGASVDGRELSVEDGRFLELADDGQYRLTYGVKSEGGREPQEYELMFLRDTTPPAINWDGEIRGGRFVGTVRFSVDDPEAEVSIWYNGQPAYTENGYLAAAGSYLIIAADRSGNMRSWQFVLEQQDEIPWTGVGIFFGALFLIALLVVLTARQGMRVR